MANSLTESRRKIILNSPHITSASGSIVSVNDAIKAKLKSCVVDINPVQSGSGDPSPDNKRPISGWDGCDAIQTGTNIFDGNLSVDVTSINDILKDGATYTVTGDLVNPSQNTYLQIWRYDKRQSTYTNIGSVISATSKFPRTFTADLKNYDYALFVVNQTSLDNIKNVQIEIGSTATAYEPYTSTTYPISWQTEAGIVYGGTLDVTNGVLTVSRVSETKKWGDLVSVTDLGTNERRRFIFANVSKYTLLSASDDLKCNIIGVYDTSYSLDNIHMYIASSNYAWVYLPDTTDSNTDIQLSYSIATPTTYQLTPTEINALLGTNNIWADTGDISVKYWAHS